MEKNAPMDLGRALTHFVRFSGFGRKIIRLKSDSFVFST